MTSPNSPEPGLGRNPPQNLDYPPVSPAVVIPFLVVDEARETVIIDDAELSAFYETHIEGLLTYLARKAGRGAADDLASRIFEQFLLWRPGHPDHPAPVAALYRIAQCRLADHLRRHGQTLAPEASDLEQALQPVDDGPWDGFAAVDLRLDLEQALAKLTERERQALLLRYAAQLPVKECAEVLGLGVDNMKKILSRALRTLRQSPRMNAYDTAGRGREPQQ